MNSKEKLMKIKSEGFFTQQQSFEEFVSELCKRYARTFGEFLPVDDYDYIVSKLEQNEVIESQDDPRDTLDESPIYL